MKCPATLGEQRGDSPAAHTSDPAGEMQQLLDLIAALLILHAPLAEMLAVVGEKPVAVFPNAGAGPTRHFRTSEASRSVDSNPDRSAEREASERNLFHRAAAPSNHSGSVVDDVAASDIDAVVGEAVAWRNQVRAQGWFLVCHQ
jgi:hypothetical protein